MYCRHGCRSGDVDAAASLSGVRAGHEPRPRHRRLLLEGLPEDVERVVGALEVELADAGVVVQVVAEVLVAVAHVVHAVEHVRVPDFIDVRRRGNLPSRVHLAQLQEARVLGQRLLEAGFRPLRVLLLHDRVQTVDGEGRRIGDEGADLHGAHSFCS